MVDTAVVGDAGESNVISGLGAKIQARVVRELTMGSVSLLDEVIEMTDDQPRPGQPTIISEEHLREYRAGRALVAPLPEEIPSGATYVEGSVKRVLVNRY